MYFCLACGSPLTNFPVPRHRNISLYGCPVCGMLFTKREGHYSGPDLESVAGATYEETLLAYQEVIPGFETKGEKGITGEDSGIAIAKGAEVMFGWQKKIEEKWRKIRLPAVVRLALIEA